MPIKLQFLGHHAVFKEQTPIKFATDYTLALLAYLAVEADRPHARVTLATLLWPEQPEPKARQNLRQALYQARKTLMKPHNAIDLFTSTPKTIRCHPALVDLDVRRFETLLAAAAAHPHDALVHCPVCMERLEQAVALYQGEFLRDLVINGSDPFEAWLRQWRERCHRQVMEALATLAEASATRAAYERMGEYARRQLALEPWNEAAHRQLMRSLARSGQRAAALAHYAICCHILDDELGVSPSPETVAVYAQIRTDAPNEVTKWQGDEGNVPPASTALSSSQIDWGEMPTVDRIYGRARELDQLAQWLTHECGRLIAVVGMGGVGKTTLAAHAVRHAANYFERVIWRSLLNAPPCDEIVLIWLQQLSNHTVTEWPERLDARLNLLFEFLRRQRCLLVLDNLESVLLAGEAGQVRAGYAGYVQLIQRFGATEHQGCLLLTSREQPRAMTRLLGSQSGVHLLSLSGVDTQSGEAILAAQGLVAAPADGADLVAHYSGNPLALQIIANTIVELFGGDVAAFQRTGGAIFGDIRTVLDEQFARLSALERELIIWLAVEREAVDVSQLRANLVRAVAPPILLEALHGLQRRALLEKRDNGFTLQNVVLEYTTAYLIEQVCQEIESARPALFNSHALLKAQAKEYVRQSQARLILQPIAERLVTSSGKNALVTQLQHILAVLRTKPRQPGYAAGNLLNLLCHLGVDLSGYDFSGLCVWQADLRGMLVTALNFTAADLAHSAFTLIFDTHAVKFHPSGALLVAGVSGGDFCLWQVVDGQLTHVLRSASSGGYPMIFSSDGQLVAAAGFDSVIRIWSTASGACLQSLHGHTGKVCSLAFSPDANLLASGTAERVVYLWDLRSGHLRQRLDGHVNGVEALAFSPDGRILASGDSGHVIRLWNTAAAAEERRLINTLEGHTREIGALAFSPDGVYLASGSHDGVIRMWDLTAQGAHVQTLQGHTSIIRALLFQPHPETHQAGNHHLLASGSADQTVRLWSASGQLLYTLVGHTNEVEALTFSADGQLLASSGADQSVSLWNPRTGQALNSLQTYRNRVNSVRFGPDGDTVASGSADSLIHLWEITPQAGRVPERTGRLIRVLTGHAGFVRSVVFSPAGVGGARLLASGSADQTVRLWEFATGRELHALQGQTGVVAFGPDGTLLASAGADRTIRLWSVAENLRLRSHHHRLLVGHQDDITSVAFSPDGRTLVSGSLDSTVRLWDVESGAMRHILAGHTTAVSSVAFSPDGRMVATSSFDHTVRLWSAATGQCLRVQKGEQMGERVVAFSPDGELLAYDGADLAIYLWHWRTGAAPYALRGHTNFVLSLDFSPTAPLLASCSMDTTLRLWDLETNTCRQTLRTPGPYAGMNITGVTSVTVAQKAALRVLGAVESPS